MSKFDTYILGSVVPLSLYQLYVSGSVSQLVYIFLVVKFLFSFSPFAFLSHDDSEIRYHVYVYISMWWSLVLTATQPGLLFLLACEGGYVGYIHTFLLSKPEDEYSDTDDD
jgi:hypothetical protein